ncbi:DNA primase [uncultured Roseobacter sp.]|uniref:DNA primase n=1 Tax=uncultured Roseobacter sp. TaxID=114847 RepID=UPI00262D80B7|nr:DNA primase [uncultured Roseobacter sp.]
MSLPPGFLDELRTRLSLTSVVGRKVTWDMRKSNQAKGDMWAPCPFHQEKSASFHVDDRKGFYYCFGCHAKGDAISFVRETENVGFMEAVEILARETGMPMPARDPQAQQKADVRSQLAEVMEQAVRYFRLQLNTGAATEARRYLESRGLDAEALERWEIGFAPDAWQGLWDHLKAKNVDDQLILDAGLAKPSSKGGKPYDTFRGRIIFPIRDARGRAIAFGGRAMDPNDNAKYLNSPETALFDKGRSLYNHGPARTAAGKGQPLLVAEGYMDVIALSSYGFEAAVAPLGTAVTENQLQMLWRIAPEPIVALDGDTAGQRAAMRLIDLALPLLEAGRSLRFAMMPPGKDPDDLLREGGAAALQTLLDAAQPMVRLMWDRAVKGREDSFDSPERKAALDKELREQIFKIKDPSIRSHYGQQIKDWRWQLFKPARPQRQGAALPRWQTARQPARLTTKTSEYATNTRVEIELRERIILAALVQCPEVIGDFEAAIEAMPCAQPETRRLQQLLLSSVDQSSEMLRQQISESFGDDFLEKLTGKGHLTTNPFMRLTRNSETARKTVTEELAKLQSTLGLDAEISEAAEDNMSDTVDERLTWRLSEAANAAERARKSGQENDAEYDMGTNGALIDKGERAALDKILGAISFVPKRKQ